MHDTKIEVEHVKVNGDRISKHDIGLQIRQQ